jgi:uncharacterized membrane protein YhaH (DUF805 family)
MEGGIVEKLSPIGWAIRPLKHYADFRGRAPRAEYWWYTLALMICLGLGKIVDIMLGLKNLVGIYGPVSAAVLLATILSSLAVQTRRLHDLNRSGLWLLMLYGPEAAIFGMTGVRMSALNSRIPPSDGFFLIVGILAIVLIFACIAMFIAFIMHGTRGPNRFGPDPYSGEYLEEVFA